MDRRAGTAHAQRPGLAGDAADDREATRPFALPRRRRRRALLPRARRRHRRPCPSRGGDRGRRRHPRPRSRGGPGQSGSTAARAVSPSSSIRCSAPAGRTGIDAPPRPASTSVLERAERRGAGIGWIEPIPFADAFGLDGTTETFDVSQRQRRGRARAAERGRARAASRRARRGASRRRATARSRDTDRRRPVVADDARAGRLDRAQLESRHRGHRVLSRAPSRRDRRRAVPRRGARRRASPVRDRDRRRRLPLDSPQQRAREGPLLSRLVPWTSRHRAALRRAGASDRRSPSGTAWLRGGGEAVLASGAPEQRSRGYWNNVGQCCGDAACRRVRDQPVAAARRPALPGPGASRRGAGSSGRASPSRASGRSWPQAEHRVRPELSEAQTGYMQGAAGRGQLPTATVGARLRSHASRSSYRTVRFRPSALSFSSFVASSPYRDSSRS